MSRLLSRKVLISAALASLAIHLLLLFTVDLKFAPIDTSSPVLNLRLVKPLVELPAEPLPEAPPVAPIADPTPLAQPPTSLNAIEVDELHQDQSVPLEIPEFEPAMDPSQENEETENTSRVFSVAELTRSVVDIHNSQLDSNPSRIRTFTNESTFSIEETFYLQSWLRKVQRIGQLNYPKEAVEQKLYGQLSIYVSIAPDGSLVETRVLESSGFEVLDEAAVRIVKLAAPFAPFPQSMRNTTDLLEIIRTWEFRKNSVASRED